MRAIIFGTPRKLVDLPSTSIQNIVLDGRITNYCKSVKYLGVILDDTLSWLLQTSEVCKRSMRVLSQLKMNGDVFSMNAKKLVITLVSPIFDYCAVVFMDFTGQ